MILYTDGQVFENRTPKEAYIAVVTDQEELILFKSVGYHSVHDTEGLALLHALEYIAKHKALFSSIYTDSLSWTGIVNGHTRLHGVKIEDLYTKELARRIIELKKKHFVSITWKGRKHNLAGHFLARVWGWKKAQRQEVLQKEVESE